MFGSSTKDKDSAFFDAFARHAETTRGAATLLVEMLARLPSRDAASAYKDDDGGELDAVVTRDLERIAASIKEAETAGDTITHDTIRRLHENWITPLDRDDIHTLVSRMDDVLDDIEAAADRIVLFEIRFAVPEAAELAAILVKACDALGKATGLLGTMKKSKEIVAYCVEVNRLENEADRVHRKATTEMFRRGNDPLTVMKWRDVFESLESAADRCEDVANVIEGVVLEYA